jgi:hypothetical protein
MKERTLQLLLSVMVLVLLGGAAHAQHNRLMYTPSLSVVEPGDTFEVHLALDSTVSDVMVYLAHIKFDSTVIRLIDAWPDSAWYTLSQADSQYFLWEFETTEDTVTGDSTWFYRVFDIIWSGIPKVTIDGYAEISTLQFEALAHGASYLYFDTTVVKNPQDSIVVTEVGNGLVYVCPLPPGYTFASDVNGDGTGPDVSDLVYLVTYMFAGGPAPVPIVLSADVNCDITVDVSDLVYLVTYMFQGGPAPCNHCP